MSTGQIPLSQPSAIPSCLPPSQIPMSQPSAIPTNMSTGQIPSTSTPAWQSSPSTVSDQQLILSPPLPSIPTSLYAGEPSTYHSASIPSRLYQPPAMSYNFQAPPSNCHQTFGLNQNSAFQPTSVHSSDMTSMPYFIPAVSVPNQTSQPYLSYQSLQPYRIENALHQNSMEGSLPMPVPPSSQYQTSVYSVGTPTHDMGSATSQLGYQGVQSNSQVTRVSKTKR